MPLDLSKLQNVKPNADGWQAACPICRLGGSDNKGNHLKIWRDGRWSCVVAHGEKVHNQGIWQLAGDGTDSTGIYATEAPAQTIEIERVWDSKVLDRLIKDYGYWEGRGILAETVIPFRGGIATEGQMKDRWVIPIFNEEDGVIGFTGRALKDGMSVKWKHLGKTSKWVWGGKEEVQDADRVILVESPADLLSLRQQAFPECLCLFGVNISQCLLAYLIALNPTEIIISTNNDIKHDVGQRAAIKIRNTLTKFFSEDMISIRLPTQDSCKDWNEVLRVRPEHINETFGIGL